VSPRSSQTELRSLLGCFLFSDEEVFKKIGVLSGGERGRYALLRMLLHPANFLLLDEPTNHLDLRAKDVLLNALMGYTGTVVFVSHDRYFIDRLASRVFGIGEGKVEVYPGNYEDYLWRKEGRASAAPTLDDVPKLGGARKSSEASSARMSASGVSLSSANVVPTNGNQVLEASLASDEPKGKRLNPIKRKQMEDRVQKLEEEIAHVEAAIAHCETALQNFTSSEESQRQSQELDQHKARHVELIREWEEISKSLQGAES
jgi:ATP-binding cassette subfamily F protein 3